MPRAKRCITADFRTGLVIADDSGLVVPALGGAPGVHSARYAGPDASDADRIRKLLRRDARQERRRAPRAIRVRDRAGRSGPKLAACFRRPPKENCWKRREGRRRFRIRSDFFLPCPGKDICGNLARRKKSPQPSRKSVSQGARISYWPAARRARTDCRLVLYSCADIMMKEKTKIKTKKTASQPRK